MLFKPSGCCNIQSQNTSRSARWAAPRGTVTQGWYGFQLFRVMYLPPFVTGISRTVKIAGIEMLVRFFLHSVTNCRALYTRSLGHAQWSTA